MVYSSINRATIIGIAIVVCILIALIILLVLSKKNKEEVKVDEELINNLIVFLGGKSNIKDYNKENARVKFEVNDLEKVKLNDLKAISQNGVFITGKNVKTLFKYESDEIIKMLDKSLK